MPFTQNFNYCMEQKKYTAYKFAKIIGASNQGVLNWQSGECIPYPKTKKKIADHFGITLAELDGDELPVLPKEGIKKETSGQKAEGLIPYDDKELINAIEKLRRMDKKTLRKFSALANAMLED